MCTLNNFLEDLHEFLTGTRNWSGCTIRRHTKKLQELGDISFPLNKKSWSRVTVTEGSQLEECTIFQCPQSENIIKPHLERLLKVSETWHCKLKQYKIIKSDVHLFLDRSSTASNCIKEVLNSAEKYGFNKIFKDNITLCVDDETCLTGLRIAILHTVGVKLLNKLSEASGNCDEHIAKITQKSSKNSSNVRCGAVLNKNGIKDNKTTPDELYRKRTVDMQLMAQHKYGIRINSLEKWKEYFERLGRACVTLEMLQNKPHKSIKILLDDLQTAHKGPSFVFYNCARLSALLKEFNLRVSQKIYPPLPLFEDVDCSLLNQSEEWELIYVYMVQFPMVIKNTICDILLGIFNPHYLVSFLSSLVSVFSVYYRRVKILIDPKEHLFSILHARIYMLKALQQVFHNCLFVLNIEPVNKM